MKIITSILLIITGILCFYLMANAAPFLVCDPPPAGSTMPTFYKIASLPGVPAQVPKDTTGTYGFKYDLASLPAGSYTVTAQACLTNASFGEVCSVSTAPFSFTKPGTPSTPTNQKLVVQ
jgi:hypothetical protein